MATRMQQRRGTASQWSTANPVLNAGEIGWESDTNKFKIGDGTNHWNDLSYFLDSDSISTTLGDYVETSELGQPSGVATLDPNGKLEPSQLPDVAQVTVHAVADQAARLALSVQPGDIAIQSDTGQTFVLSALPASTNANWTMITVADPFPSKDTDDLAEGSANLYFTNERAQDAIGLNVGTGLSYDDASGSVSVSSDVALKSLNNTFSGNNLFTGQLVSDGSVVVNGDLVVNGTTTTINASELAIADNIIYLNEPVSFDVTNAVGNGTSVTYTVGSHSITSNMVVSVTGINPSSLNTSGYVSVVSVTDTTITVANTSTSTYISGGILLASAGLNPDLGIVGAYNDGTYAHAGIVRDASDQVFKFFNGYVPEPGQTIDFSEATLAGIMVGSATIGSVTNNEIQYLSGVTSSIQSQIDSKASETDLSLKASITSLDNHINDTTNVHGIANTADLAYQSDITNHAAVTLNVHGISNTAELVYQSELLAHTGDVSAHGVSGNIVGTSDTQTLTNKTIDLASNTVTTTIAQLNTAVSDADLATRAGTETLTNKTISAAENTLTIAPTDLTGVTASAAEINILDGATLSTTELNYVDGVTSAIQTQLDGKAASSHTHAQSDITNLVSDLSAKAPLESPTFTGTVTLPAGTVTSGVIANGTIVNEDISATAAIALSKLATDPLARANHTGTQTASTISDFDTQVRASRLDQMSAPTASVSMNSQRITNLAAPTDASDAVTKAYVDGVSEGLHIHEAARVYAAANINLSNQLEAGDTIDGVTLVAGDRVLVNGQTTQSQNGIYVVQTSGAAVRALDFDTPTEVSSGDFVFVAEGTLYANTGWVQTRNVGTVGTDPISFTQFSGAGTYVAGTGLTLNGSTFSINTATTVDVATAQTLTNKTINLTSNTLSGTTAQFNAALSDADFATLAGTETLTNKTINLANNTLSGTTAQFNASLSDADFATIAGTETLTNKTFTSPAMTSPSVTSGALTLSASGVTFSDGTTQVSAGVPSITTITQRTASHTLANLNERDTIIEINSASATTLTIPTDATLNFPVGTTLDIIRTGTGTVAIAGASGVTVNATPGLNLRAQWSSATLLKRAANTWLAYGDLAV